MQAHKRQQKVYMQALCDHGWAWPEWPQGGEISRDLCCCPPGVAFFLFFVHILNIYIYGLSEGYLHWLTVNA